jgi:prepilin peptidase CpaA
MREALSLLPMVVLLVWAAVIDVRDRRIPNWLTATLALGGLIQAAMGVSSPGVGSAALGLGVGFAITFVFFAIGGMGAGDVKLFAGLGAWVGAVGIIQVFVIERVIGIVLVLVQAWRTRRLRAVVLGSAVLAANAVLARDPTCASANEEADQTRSRLAFTDAARLADGVVSAETTGRI